MDIPILNPLEFYPRFLHVAEQIFEQLDKKSLKNCREVAKSWQQCIDNKNLSWNQIIKIPTVLKNEDTLKVCTKLHTAHEQMFDRIKF